MDRISAMPDRVMPTVLLLYLTTWDKYEDVKFPLEMHNLCAINKTAIANYHCNLLVTLKEIPVLVT